MLSGRSLKLMAGGMSVLVLALLALLAVGFFSDSPPSPSTSSGQVSTSNSPNTMRKPLRRLPGVRPFTRPLQRRMASDACAH